MTINAKDIEPGTMKIEIDGLVALEKLPLKGAAKKAHDKMVAAGITDMQTDLRQGVQRHYGFIKPTGELFIELSKTKAVAGWFRQGQGRDEFCQGKPSEIDMLIDWVLERKPQFDAA